MDPIVICSGDSLRLQFNVTQSDGSIQDLAGASVEFRVGLSRCDPILSKSTIEGGVTITDAGAGQVDIVVPAGELVDPGTYNMALTVVLATGDRFTPIKMGLIVTPVL